MQAIYTDHLTKAYKTVTAVDSISLTISAGEAVGLLGPNGAGKTTLLEMIEGITPPTSGTLRVFGKEWKGNESELRGKIGLCFQETQFMDRLTVSETLRLFASFYRLPASRADDVIGLVNLTEKKESYVERLSGGQRQRVAIAIAILNQPQLLMLDEPTTGLDPKAREDVWTLIESLKKTGLTLILTTHYMEEAESLCDRIIMMNRGRVVTDGTLAELHAKNPAPTIVRQSTLNDLFAALTGQDLGKP